MQLIKEGFVTEGEYKNWRVEIYDDRNGDTGGYYFYLKNENKEVFDYWFEKKEHLDNQISEFIIKWKIY